MIPHTLRVTLLIAVICYFIIILYYLKRRMLVMGIMIYFPELTVRFVHLIGMQDNMNGLYIMCLAFIMMILMTLTSIASRQQMKIRVLIQEISMLEKRIRELEVDTKEGKEIRKD